MRRRDFLKSFALAGGAGALQLPFLSRALAWVGERTRRAKHLICLLAQGSGFAALSLDGRKWTTQALAPAQVPTEGWLDIAWNGSVFCAVGANGIATSPDGVSWTSQDSGQPDYYWNSIAWNGSVFCVLNAQQSFALTSPDGVTWTSNPLPSVQTDGWWIDVAWNGSLFCAVGRSGGIATSPDGVTWTNRLNSSNPWFRVVWTGSQFVSFSFIWADYPTVPDNIGCVATSPDGVTWSVGSPMTDPPFTYSPSGFQGSIAWNGSVFFAVSGGNGATSPDGTNWTSRVLPSGSWQMVAAGGTRFCLVAQNQSAVSTDGINWTTHSMPSGSWFMNGALAWDGSVFCFFDGHDSSAMISSDGLNWTSSSAPGQIVTVGLAGSGSIFCGIGYNDGLMTSPDGLVWTQRGWPGGVSNRSVSSIIWNGSIFCMACSDSMATSSDGINWTFSSIPLVTSSNGNWSVVRWNGSVFCALAGLTASAATSPDGVTWTARPMPSLQSWCALAWNGSVFLALAGSTAAATSSDGVTWTARTIPTAGFWSYLAAKGSLFCATDTNSTTVVSTTDGVSWGTGTIPASGFTAVGGPITASGSLFCTVQYEMVATSSDGLNWSQQTLTDVSQWGAIGWNGSVFCLLAQYADSSNPSSPPPYGATSPDGSNWTGYVLTIGRSAVSWRAITWNGKIFCALSDFNSAISPDGVRWTSGRLPVQASWNSIAWNGSLFCATDFGSNVATSPDGINWTQQTAPGFVGHVISKDSLFYVVDANTSSFFSSPDGANWTTLASGIAAQYPFLLWNGTMFLAAGWGGVISSNDGVAWTATSLGLFRSVSAVAWNGNIFCLSMAGNNGVAPIFTSPDGVNWTARPGVTDPTGSSTGVGSTNVDTLVWNGSLFVAACTGVAGLFMATSKDGVSWEVDTNMPFPATLPCVAAVA